MSTTSNKIRFSTSHSLVDCPHPALLKCRHKLWLKVDKALSIVTHASFLFNINVAGARVIPVLARANWLKSNTPNATKDENDILRDI